MKTLTNESGSKAVNITSKDGSFLCMYVQCYNGEEQVLDSKRYSRESAAVKWAKAKLA